MSGEAPRPTERFERVLAFASDAADGLGHSAVTAQHLLLALTREQRGIAHAVLTSSGLTSDAVHAWLSETGAAHDRTPFATMGMADEMREVLNAALTLAAKRGHRWLDTEHLLEALLSAPTSADDVFSALGVELSQMRAKLADYRQRAPNEPDRAEVTHAYRFTLETAWVLAQANHVGRKYAAERLSTLHLLAALLAIESPAQRVLHGGFGLTTADILTVLTPADPFNLRARRQRIPLKPDLQRTLGYAIGEAWNRGHLAVGPVHVALGMVRLERNPARDLLAQLGASHAALIDALEEALPPPVIR